MIKQLAEQVREFEIPTQFPYFKLSAGIYRDGICESFIFEVVDLQNDKKYVQSFNSAWCPEENKEWLASIIILLMTDIIKNCRDFHKEKIQSAFDGFIDSMKV